MDAFAALQGHARARARTRCSRPTRRSTRSASCSTALYRYPQLQRDVDTRDQAVAGRFQRVSAVFAKFDTAYRVVHARAAEDPAGDDRGLARADAGARAVPLPDPRRLPAQGARARREGRAAAVARRPASTTRRATIYQELSTSDIKFPTLRLADGSDVVLSPGNYAALLEKNRNQAERGKAAAAHVGTYGATAQHLRARSTTACCSATGSSRRRATSRPRSTPRSTATRSRAPSSRR